MMPCRIFTYAFRHGTTLFEVTRRATHTSFRVRVYLPTGRNGGVVVIVPKKKGVALRLFIFYTQPAAADGVRHHFAIACARRARGKLRPIWRVHSCNNIPASVAPAPVMPAMRWHTIIITINIPGRPSDTTQRCALTRPATAGAVLCVCVCVCDKPDNQPSCLAAGVVH